jgi:hypothetical protein
VVAAANGRHFARIVQSVATCVDSLLEGQKPRTLRVAAPQLLLTGGVEAMVLRLPNSEFTFVDRNHPAIAAIRERQASEQLPNVYTDDADLMDGKWCKVPVELFDEVLAQLETEVEVVQPSRQEAVSYAGTVADELESYFTDVRQQMNQQRLLSEETVGAIEAGLMQEVAQRIENKAPDGRVSMRIPLPQLPPPAPEPPAPEPAPAYAPPPAVTRRGSDIGGGGGGGGGDSYSTHDPEETPEPDHHGGVPAAARGVRV